MRDEEDAYKGEGEEVVVRKGRGEQEKEGREEYVAIEEFEEV